MRPIILGRRTFIETSAALVLTAAGGLTAQARTKVSKLEAQYQDEPRDIRMCATCSFFEMPKKCTVVLGDVSARGWCKFFAMVD